MALDGNNRSMGRGNGGGSPPSRGPVTGAPNQRTTTTRQRNVEMEANELLHQRVNEDRTAAATGLRLLESYVYDTNEGNAMLRHPSSTRTSSTTTAIASSSIGATSSATSGGVSPSPYLRSSQYPTPVAASHYVTTTSTTTTRSRPPTLSTPYPLGPVPLNQGNHSPQSPSSDSPSDRIQAGGEIVHTLADQIISKLITVRPRLAVTVPLTQLPSAAQIQNSGGAPVDMHQVWAGGLVWPTTPDHPIAHPEPDRFVVIAPRQYLAALKTPNWPPVLGFYTIYQTRHEAANFNSKLSKCVCRTEFRPLSPLRTFLRKMYDSFWGGYWAGEIDFGEYVLIVTPDTSHTGETLIAGFMVWRER